MENASENTSAENVTSKTPEMTTLGAAWESEMLFGFLIITVNIIAIIILSRSRRMIPQIRFLSINLASSDLLTGIMISFHGIVFTALDFYEKYLCLIYVFSLPGTMIVSIATIFLFSADRFFAIYYQMTYVKVVTKTKIVCVCACTWIMSATFLILWNTETHVPDNKNTCLNRDYMTFGVALVGLTVLSSVSTALTLLCYLGIYLAVRRQLKRVGPDSAVKKINVKQLLKPTIQISIVAGTFLITYFPAYLVTTYILVHGERTEDLYYPTFYATYTFSTLNSVINPFLYVWRFTECRYELALLFCSCNERMSQKIRAKRNRLHAEFLQDTNVEGSI